MKWTLDGKAPESFRLYHLNRLLRACEVLDGTSQITVTNGAAGIFIPAHYFGAFD
jgi:hypothetical protein